MNPASISREELDRIKMQVTFCNPDELSPRALAISVRLGWWTYTRVSRRYIRFEFTQDVIPRLGPPLRALFGLAQRPRITWSAHREGNNIIATHAFTIPVSDTQDDRAVITVLLQVLMLIDLVGADEIVVV